MTDRNNLILGVDGGGSKTVAWLAVRASHDGAQVIGRGRSGSSNCRSVGMPDAIANLEDAIASSFKAAHRSPVPVGSACLALAGADRQVEQDQFRSWAADHDLADRLTITNDAMPVLYAASGEGVGIALISGTGSVAVGRSEKGDVLRCGGWGSLLGDEGSGYQIALSGLRAAVRSADGRADETSLLQRTLDYFNIGQLKELIPALYSPDTTRETVAGFAPIVFQAAAGNDPVASQIIQCAAENLSELVATLAKRLNLSADTFVLGVSGGVLVHQEAFVAAIADRLVKHNLNVSITTVEEPVSGTITIALADCEE